MIDDGQVRAAGSGGMAARSGAIGVITRLARDRAP
jgi:hypothetical protein